MRIAMIVPQFVQDSIREAERLGRLGDLEAAITIYQRVLAQWPGLPDSWYNLGLLQTRSRQFEPALLSYRRALQFGITAPEEVHLNCAVIYTDWLRNDAAAMRELRLALELNPTYVPALQNLANLHTDWGQRDEAVRAYRQILTLDPTAFEALARYSQLEKFKGAADPLIARLEAGLRHAAAGPAERASLGFALARALDSVGEYRRAFLTAETANRDSRASAPQSPRYDRAAHERFVDELISVFARRAAPAIQLPAPAARPQPIFICGMFRSGSTLTEQLLAGAAGVHPAGELDFVSNAVKSRLAPFPASMVQVSRAALSSLSQEYLADLARLWPTARWVTDKRPDNFLYVGLIKTLFPDARIVHTTRDALDTCLSIYFTHLDPSVSYALDLQDIAHYYRQYQRLMGHWSDLYGGNFFELNYDTLVREPSSTARRLFEYCDLPWDESHLDFARRPRSVKTASVWQVREPLYQRSSGRARHYAAELASLTSELTR